MKAEKRFEIENPILAHELRRSLQGQRFAWPFLVLLFVLVALVLWVVIDEEGKPFSNYASDFALIAAGGTFGALHLFLPFWLLGAGLRLWDEQALEEYALANIEPSTVVRGLFACALLQAVLLCSAVAPVYVFAWSARGLPLLDLAILFAFQLLLAVPACACGFALGLMGKRRGVRPLLFVLLVMGQFVLLFPNMTAYEMLRRGETLDSDAMGCLCMLSVAFGFPLLWIWASGTDRLESALLGSKSFTGRLQIAQRRWEEHQRQTRATGQDGAGEPPVVDESAP